MMSSNPLRYTLMTHGAEASLPTIATIMKTQYAKIRGRGDGRGHRPTDLPAAMTAGP